MGVVDICDRDVCLGNFEYFIKNDHLLTLFVISQAMLFIYEMTHLEYILKVLWQYDKLTIIGISKNEKKGERWFDSRHCPSSCQFPYTQVCLCTGLSNVLFMLCPNYCHDCVFINPGWLDNYPTGIINICV